MTMVGAWEHSTQQHHTFVQPTCIPAPSARAQACGRLGGQILQPQQLPCQQQHVNAPQDSNLRSATLSNTVSASPLPPTPRLRT